MNKICLKQHLFALVCLSIPSGIFAQKYIPMNFSQGVWIEKENHKTDYSWKQLYCQGDTSIDGQVYHNLYEFRINYYAPGYYPDTVSSSLIGTIGENDSKQVMFKSIYDTDFSIIYDFNLEVGDSIHLEEDVFVINEIDSIEICGRFHKRYIQDISREEFPESLIEGIGFSNGLLGQRGHFDFHESYNLLECYTELNNGQCAHCELLLNYYEKKNNYNIYPNPTSGDILISSSKPFFKVSIYNLHGIEILSIDNIYVKSRIISLANYSSGLYIVKIDYQSNSTGSTIIIKK